MKKPYKPLFSLTISIVLLLTSGFKITDSSPGGIMSYHLFRIERSRDADEINYDINLKSNGMFNSKEPIHIYWLKNTKRGEKEGLSWIQKKFGYGLKFMVISKAEAKFRFVSHIDRDFILKKDENGRYKVFTISKDLWVEVIKLFIQFDGGSFISPKISRVELHGLAQISGEQVVEIINP